MELFRADAWWARVRVVLWVLVLFGGLLALPAGAQSGGGADVDGVRSGAVWLGEQSAGLGRQFFRGYSLDRAGGDAVDYFSFSTDARYELGLGVRGQSVDLLVYLEGADGGVVAVSGPPLDPSKDQSVEWLSAVVEAGTYWVRVEAQQDGATGYYVRFGLAEVPDPDPEPAAAPDPDGGAGPDGADGPGAGGLREDAEPSAPTAPEPVPVPGLDGCEVVPPPRVFGTGAFYEKYCSAGGIHILASGEAADVSVQIAWHTTMNTLAATPRIHQRLADSDLKVVIFAVGESPSDHPWPGLLSGMGAFYSWRKHAIFVTEQNLLCWDEDREDEYVGQDVLIHELAHPADTYLRRTYGGFGSALDSAYEEAMGAGRWAGHYASTNAREYWAEGVKMYLNGDWRPSDGLTREELAEYDPALFSLVSEYFPAFSADEWQPWCTDREPINPVAPASPSNVREQWASKDAVVLTWDEPATADGVTGYQIRRRLHGGEPSFEVIEWNTRSSATSYEDSAVVPGARYVYDVTASNARGFGEPSDPVDVTVPLIPGLGLSAVASDRAVGVRVVLPGVWGWGAAPSAGDRAVGDVFLERAAAAGGGGGWVVVDWAPAYDAAWGEGGADGVLRLFDDGVAAGGSYRYRVRAEMFVHDGRRWVGGGEVLSRELAVAVPVGVPEGPVGLSAATRDGRVRLGWEVPAQPVWANAAVMRVWRAQAGRKYFGEVAQVEWRRGVTAYEYVDASADPGRAYRYRVSLGFWAAAAEGEPFNEVSGGTALGSEVVSYSAVPAGSAAARLAHGGGSAARLGVTADDVAYLQLTPDPQQPAQPQQAPAPQPPPLPAQQPAQPQQAPAPQPPPLPAQQPAQPQQAPAPQPPPLPAQQPPPSVRQPMSLRLSASRQAPLSAPLSARLSSSGGVGADVADRGLVAQALWSGGGTLWVSARPEGGSWDGSVRAYSLADGSRDAARDIDLALPGPGEAVRQLGASHGLWMDAGTVWVSSTGTARLLAYDRASGARKPAQDYTALDAAGNDSPGGLWASPDKMYVVDTDDGRVYMYDRRTKAHTGHYRVRPHSVGIWSDGITIWVSSRTGAQGARIHAYQLSKGEPDFHKDIRRWPFRGRLAADNTQPAALWSDRTQIWTTDTNTDKIYIYDLPADPRLTSLTVNGANRLTPSGEVYEAYRTYVPSSVDQVTVAAQALRPDAHITIAPPDADTDTDGHQIDLNAHSATTVTVVVAHGTTRWGRLGRQTKTYAYQVHKRWPRPVVRPPSSNALSALALTGVVLSPAFASETTDYAYRLSAEQAKNGFTTTITATAVSDNAAVDISPEDADPNTDGHQIELAAGGSQTVEISVDPGGGMAARLYTVRLAGMPRDPAKDVSIERHKAPYDIWSDGQTLWVLYSGWEIIAAHDLDTGRRLDQQDLRRSIEHSWYNTGLWSDGDTMWIAETWHKPENPSPYIEALDMPPPPGARIASESFSDAKGSRDLWSDGETIWVAFVDEGSDRKPRGDKLLAYDLATKARRSGKDITVTTTGDTQRGYWRRASFGLWSDGTVMWVAANEGDSTSRLEAYTLATGARLAAMDIAVGADGVTHPRGMWSNGRTMWVLNAPLDTNGVINVDHNAWKRTGVRAFSLAPNAKLFSLAMSDVDFGHFVHGKPKYSAEVANSVDVTTVEAVAAFSGGSSAVSITAADDDDTTADVTADADGTTDGYQVDLAEGVNTVTVEVTAPNGTDTYTYTVTITRADS